MDLPVRKVGLPTLQTGLRHYRSDRLQVGALSADPKGEDQMLSMRTMMMTAVVVVAFCMGWLAKTSAQQKGPAPLITYFSHEKVDASFAQALASAGSGDLFARKDRQGRTWTIHSNSRGK